MCSLSFVCSWSKSVDRSLLCASFSCASSFLVSSLGFSCSLARSFSIRGRRSVRPQNFRASLFRPPNVLLPSFSVYSLISCFSSGDDCSVWSGDVPANRTALIVACGIFPLCFLLLALYPLSGTLYLPTTPHCFLSRVCASYARTLSVFRCALPDVDLQCFFLVSFSRDSCSFSLLY